MCSVLLFILLLLPHLFPDNLLSPIRDTTLITKIDNDSAEVKPSSTVETIVSSAMEVTNKENIEPSVPHTKDQFSVLHQTESVPPVSINEPQEIDSSPTQSSQIDVALSPHVTLEQHFTPKMDFDQCEDIHSPLATQRSIPSSGNTFTGGESKDTKPSISNNSGESNSLAPYFTMSPTTPSNRRLSPPKKRQFLKPVQASDLDSNTPPRQSETSAVSDVTSTDAVAGESCRY